MSDFNSSDWQSMGGKSRRYVNVKTGEEISRWAYHKLKTGADYRVEAKAAKAESARSYLRPARGRKSALKADKAIQEAILQARLEKAEAKAEQKINDKISRAKAKKYKRKVVRKQLLKPGRIGARISFNDYAEYKQSIKEAKSSGVVEAYSLGAHLMRDDNGQVRDAIFMSLTDINDPPLSEEEFDLELNGFLDGYVYQMEVLGFFMHIAFKKSYASDKAQKAGIKKTWRGK